MKRPPARRLQPIRIIILVNVVVIVSLYALMQWRFSTLQGRELRLPLESIIVGTRPL